MNALAINGSPHMDEGNTALILEPFLDGMKEAGANVELFYTRKLKIGSCNGDMSCWFKNLGNVVKMTIYRCFFPDSKRLMSLFGQAQYITQALQVRSRTYG